jgi:hypothetical protein
MSSEEEKPQQEELPQEESKEEKIDEEKSPAIKKEHVTPTISED